MGDDRFSLAAVRCLFTLLLGVGLCAGCGPQVVHRPLELFVGGLSGQADRLVILVFPGASRPGCAEVTPRDVQSLDAPLTADWDRADDGAERGLTPGWNLRGPCETDG